MRFRYLITVAALMALLAVMTGCGGGGIDSSQPQNQTTVTVGSLSVSPNSSNLTVGQIQQLSATATYSDGTTKDVTSGVMWSSSDASIVTISTSGLVTSKGQGNATISATISSVKGTASVVVNAPAPTLQSVTVSPSSPSMTVGQNEHLTATGLYSDGSSKDLSSTVAWSTSNPSIASVDASGNVTAVGQGNATINASMSSVTGAAVVAVSATPVTITGLGVTPNSATVSVGGTLQFSATETLSNLSTQNATQSVSWSSSDPTVATIDSNGLLTANKPGSTTVTATSGSFTASSAVTVSGVTLQSIYLVPGTGSAAAGESLQFSAYGIYSDNSQQDLTSIVSWYSSDTNVATVLGGLAQTKSSGLVTITASYDSLSASGNLQVTSATLSSLAISPYLPSIAVGGFQQFTATGIFSDGTSQDLSTGVTWGSDNSSIATVSSSGLAAGLTAASAVISACIGSVCDSTVLTVSPATLESISILPESANIAVGTTQQFSAIATYSDGSTQDISSGVAWSSSQPGSVSVNSTGLVSGSAAASNVIVNAQSGFVIGTAILNVTPATLTSIVVTPAMQTVGVNTTIQFTATGIYSDSSTQDITNQVVWTSSDVSVATTNNSGMVTTAALGTDQISATYDGITGTTELTVNTTTLVSVTINQSATSPNAIVTSPLVMGVHTQDQLYAWGTYSDGSTRRIVAGTWSSSKPSVASANGSGVVRSKNKTGSATIAAMFGGIEGTLAVNVTKASLSSISIAPANASIATGTQQQYTLLGTYSDGSTQDLTLQGSWQTSSFAMVTISKGIATGVAPGTVSISATFQGLNAASVSLTVTNATVQSLVVNPPLASVTLGTTQQFSAIASFSDGTQQDVSSVAQWSSSNSAVAVVGKSGLAVSSGCGSTNITASFQSISKGAVVTVN